jgi:hypothetical protein
MVARAWRAVAGGARRVGLLCTEAVARCRILCLPAAFEPHATAGYRGEAALSFAKMRASLEGIGLCSHPQASVAGCDMQDLLGRRPVCGVTNLGSAILTGRP